MECLHPYKSCHTSILEADLGSGDGWVGKGYFHPRLKTLALFLETTWWSREPIPQSCLLTSMCVLWHTTSHTHKIKNKVWVSFLICLLQNWLLSVKLFLRLKEFFFFFHNIGFFLLLSIYLMYISFCLHVSMCTIFCFMFAPHTGLSPSDGRGRCQTPWN